ncbi:MAG: enoyl-CoA hydratase-related protein, partial [Alphaproteobacteria bacterium]
RLAATEAAERGLLNRVCPDDQLQEATREMALGVAERGPFALAAIKHAFLARHGGVIGLSRVTHDLLLRPFLDTKESKELGASFREKRKPDTGTFGH